jgi:hypothetical protein
MRLPEPGETSHGKHHMTKERDYTRHLREGVKHLEYHLKEERRPMEHRKETRKEGHR